MRRREFLTVVSGGAIAAAQSQVPRTEVYKKVDGLDLKADIFSGAEGKRPAIVWIHGGALIMGGRRSVPQQLRQRLLNAGFAIVSIEYRLAPETKLPGIIDDLRDAFRWVRAEGPRLNIDPERIAAA